jgi:hypothetical protein
MLTIGIVRMPRAGILVLEWAIMAQILDPGNGEGIHGG